MRSSKVLLYLINDILDLTQITNGNLKLNPQHFGVEETVREVAELIRFQARAKGLEFIFDNKFKKDCIRLYSDPVRLKQILLNLLANALKFTERGHIKVTIGPPPSEEQNEEEIRRGRSVGVNFIVEDTGSGIGDEEIPNLFQFFANLNNKDRRKTNLTGVGIGLSVSQKLVKELNDHREGYEIKVQSQWQIGSRFEFTVLPYQEAVPQGEKSLSESINFELGFAEASKAALPLPEMSTKVFFSNMTAEGLLANSNLNEEENRILIVDDDQINITVITRYFEDYKGFSYDLAFNGRQALELILKNAEKKIIYDLVLMDCNMPVMDGFEATRKINEMITCGRIPFMPVCAATANASPSDHENCFKSGMIDVISKPFGKKQLKEKIDEILRKYKTRR